MSNQPCSLCQKTSAKHKAALQCEICEAEICKYCIQQTDENDFIFDIEKPKYLKNGIFCLNCFDREVQPLVNNYNELSKKAEDIAIFLKNQGKETRFISRIEKPIVIKECPDEATGQMMLAYQAVKKSFNAVVDVELISKKVRHQSYQTTIWSAQGVPANVSDSKLLKDRSLWSNPN